MPQSVIKQGATPAGTVGPSHRRYLLGRWKALEDDRSTWLTHWQDLNDYILPRRLRYLQTERNNGSKRHDKIINNAATRAARILAAGKMAGQTSPARPWIRYSPGTDAPSSEEATWTSDTEREVKKLFDRSNLYTKLHEMWLQQGVFGTAVLYVEEDDQDDVRGVVFPLGQYCLACSRPGGRVDIVYRRFQWTVEQTVNTFGIDSVSERVVEKFKRKQYDLLVQIQHSIEPNTTRDPTKIDNGNMEFRSDWIEVDAPEDHEGFLRRSGYEELPFFVARWNVLGEDTYGSDCPGMDCLGDNKGMQVLEKRKAEAVDKTVRPPIKAPVSARANKLSLLPADVSFVDESGQNTKVEPIMQIRAESILAAKDAISEHEARVNETFYVHLFLAMLLRPERKGKQPVTAAEVAEVSDEKMLMLGPVVTRDTDDVLDPLQNRVVRILARRGRLMPVPPGLQGGNIKIDYISVMNQAQKLLGTGATERFASFVGSLSAAVPKVKHVPNWIRIVKNYAEMLGVSPDEVNTDDVIEALTRAEQEAQQQAQAMVDLKTGADAAKAASGAELSNDSMLSRLMAGTGLGAPGMAYTG